jgi:predicted permease
MPADFSKALARFVIVFALPIALFIAAAKANAADIFNVRIMFALFGLTGSLLAQTFLLGVLPTATEVSAIAVARSIYREQASESTILSVLAGILSIGMGITAALYLK